MTEAARRDPLFSGLPGRLAVFGWHEDSFELPPGAVPLAGSIACTYQAFRFDVAAYGLQFHPEVRAAACEVSEATSASSRAAAGRATATPWPMTLSLRWLLAACWFAAGSKPATFVVRAAQLFLIRP